MKEITINRAPVILYDRRDIMSMLGVSRRTIQSAQTEGRLKYRKIGKTFYSTDDELAEYLEIKKSGRLGRW